MVIGIVKIRLFAPWVHSLKEKRMIIRSITAKVRNKFNVSITEVEDQDLHQSVVLGIAYVAGDGAQADSICDNVINFIESSTEAEIIHIEREMY